MEVGSEAEAILETSAAELYSLLAFFFSFFQIHLPVESPSQLLDFL